MTKRILAMLCGAALLAALTFVGLSISSAPLALADPASATDATDAAGAAGASSASDATSASDTASTSDAAASATEAAASTSDAAASATEAAGAADADQGDPAQGTATTAAELSDEDNGALDASISDLLNADVSLNAASVVFTGEAVASPIYADAEHTWVTLSSGGDAVAVYMRDTDAALIEHFGDYDETGDTVEVTGTFYLDCETHEGDVDVHAVAVEVVASGGAREQAVDGTILRAGIVLVALGVVAGLVYWRLRERQR